MRTTLNIPDGVYARIKERAASRHQTITDTLTDLLRAGLDRPELKHPPIDLPVYHSTEPSEIDLSDPEAIKDLIQEQEMERFYSETRK